MIVTRLANKQPQSPKRTRRQSQVPGQATRLDVYLARGGTRDGWLFRARSVTASAAPS